MKLKFSAIHYNSLKYCIETWLSETGCTIEELEKQGRSEESFLWGMLWACGWTVKHREHYYEGDYKDSHITSALRAIVKELKTTQAA